MFANIHHHSTALFALQQCLVFAPRGLSSLSALQQGYVQSVHPYRTLLPTCACPVPFAGAPAGEPALALSDGVTDVTLSWRMHVGVFVLSCSCLCPLEKSNLRRQAEKNLDIHRSYHAIYACRPPLESNPALPASVRPLTPLCYTEEVRTPAPPLHVSSCRRKETPGGSVPTAPGLELTTYGVAVKCVSGILLSDVVRNLAS